MLYRRHPNKHRKYFYPNNKLDTNDESNTQGHSGVSPGEVAQNDRPSTVKEVEKIPFPNEVEERTDITQETRAKSPLSFFHSLFQRIRIEEIILIGLILLLVDEQIEDEFLLIMLIYVFIT